MAGGWFGFLFTMAGQEAEKLGFTTILVSKHNKISLKNTKIKIVLVSKIEDVVSELFG